MIVRWGLGCLPAVLAELEVERPFAIGSERWRDLDVPHVAWWSEVPSARAEAPAHADCVLAIGGGSAIDTGKAVSAATGLPLVSVPTTYSGAEWTTFFGVRTRDRRIVGGGSGANVAGVVYDVDLTLGLPHAESGGTALNALAHCAEALYVRGHNAEGDEASLEGARLIAMALPMVLHDGRDHDHRAFLLQGAMHAGRALGLAGLALGHAMAQALGGTLGLPHGAMNALCLPPALRFNEPHAPDAVARFGAALGDLHPATHCEQLARTAGFERLRDFGVERGTLRSVAQAAATRAGNKANPAEATPDEIEELLVSIW